MVGDRDRAEAAVAGGLEQHLDRRGAIGGVIGVHVQVDLDQLSAGDSPAHRRVPGGVVAASRDRRVERIELVGDLRPAAAGPGLGGRPAHRRQRRGVLGEAGQLPGQGLGSRRAGTSAPALPLGPAPSRPGAARPTAPRRRRGRGGSPREPAPARPRRRPRRRFGPSAQPGRTARDRPPRPARATGGRSSARPRRSRPRSRPRRASRAPAGRRRSARRKRRSAPRSSSRQKAIRSGPSPSLRGGESAPGRTSS